MTEQTAGAPAKREVKLVPGKMQQAEYARQDWIVDTEPGTTISDVLKPSYWFHVARDIRPYAQVEVRDCEGRWIAYLVVVNAGVNWATCALRQQIDLGPVSEEPPEAQLFLVKWVSPQSKYGVVRIADNKVLQSGFPAKSDAYAWGATNETQMNI